VLRFSLGNNGSVGGLSVDDEDIVDFDGSDFGLYFDGSDVGLASFRLDAFAIISPTEILMSFTGAGSISGIAGTVDDSDIVLFTATSLGESTAGSFELFFDASDVGLTKSGEDVDGMELLANGNLLLSTRGSFRVPGLSGRGEDLIEFTPTSLGQNTSGTWSMYFDGSDVALTSRGEDVDGVALDADGNIYLSTVGNFSTNGVSGADDDVFVCQDPLTGSTTVCTFGPIFFDGSAYGLSGNDVYAIDLP
jgi:hypothetical protein